MPSRERRLTVRLDVSELYSILYSVYGEPGWWPAETEFEVCAGAILTQSTSWKNAEMAIASLKSAGLMSAEKLAHADVTAIEELVKPSGFYRQKAERLRVFSRFLLERHHGSLEELAGIEMGNSRNELLSIHGIGEETADSILLYACNMPVFVADAYSRRILGRLGLVYSKSGYAEVKRFVERSVGGDVVLYNRLHALLVEFGKKLCRSEPACSRCFLSDRCKFGSRKLKVEKRVSNREHKDQSGRERYDKRQLG